MIYKALPNYPKETDPEEEAELAKKEAPKQPEEPVIRKETSVRDKLQSVVRDNPDLTAGIIEEWLDQIKA